MTARGLSPVLCRDMHDSFHQFSSVSSAFISLQFSFRNRVTKQDLQTLVTTFQLGMKHLQQSSPKLFQHFVFANDDAFPLVFSTHSNSWYIVYFGSDSWALEISPTHLSFLRQRSREVWLAIGGSHIAKKWYDHTR